MTPTTKVKPGATDEAINIAVSEHVDAYLFPGECICTPTIPDMLRAGKYGEMLRQRMRELALEGVDGTRMPASELLAGVPPDRFELTDADYDAYFG